LVKAVWERVGAGAAQNNVSLRINVTSLAALPSRTANLAKLVLVNLAENAIQATPSGGTVSILAEQAQSLLRFTVRDEGSGFPEHLRQKLFLPCASTREGGSGIGLAISHRLAEHLGAKLTLQDSSENGCVFRLDLPLEISPAIRSSQSCSAVSPCDK
jgi:two-component system, NtrC family, sensor histidine kinase HydH